jgi:serpin B
VQQRAGGACAGQGGVRVERGRAVGATVAVLCLVVIALAGGVQGSIDGPGVDLAALVAGNSAFGWTLYHRVERDGGNVVLSPYSLSTALAMAYAGARGETQREMAGVLQFPVGQQDVHTAFQALEEQLGAQDRFFRNDDSDRFELDIANALWGQERYGFLPTYNTLLETHYGAGINEVDFASNSEAARRTINEWVSDRTQTKIPELIPAGQITPDMVLVLTNAVYLKGAWKRPFDEADTAPGPFTVLSGEEKIVPMMRQEGLFFYGRSETVQALELRYENSSLAMVILLPDVGEFPAIEAALAPAEVDSLLRSMNWRLVSVEMPRFSFSSTYSLGKTLAEMGMRVAFTPDADFSGMAGANPVILSEVFHEAFIDVNEEGTEAAAATAVIAVGAGPMEPPAPVNFTVDRPFLFLIRDMQTGTILFVGRVTDIGSCSKE